MSSLCILLFDISIFLSNFVPQMVTRYSVSFTRLPVLAGAAGALGATYCSPYIAVDGAYHGRPSGQISTLTAASRSVDLLYS